MPINLTKKQTLILDYIASFTTTRGFSPSYREIMTGVGLSSVSAVAEHIDNLVKKGALRKAPGEARSLEIVDTSYPETVALFRRHLLTAPEADQETLLKAAALLGLDLEN